jgi:hypothetical protein
MPDPISMEEFRKKRQRSNGGYIDIDADPVWQEVKRQLEFFDQLRGVRRIKALAVQVPERAMAD